MRVINMADPALNVTKEEITRVTPRSNDVAWFNNIRHKTRCEIQLFQTVLIDIKSFPLFRHLFETES